MRGPAGIGCSSIASAGNSRFMYGIAAASISPTVADCAPAITGPIGARPCAKPSRMPKSGQSNSCAQASSRRNTAMPGTVSSAGSACSKGKAKRCS